MYILHSQTVPLYPTASLSPGDGLLGLSPYLELQLKPLLSFMCLAVWAACVSAHHVHAGLRKLEEGVGSLRTGVVASPRVLALKNGSS